MQSTKDEKDSGQSSAHKPATQGPKGKLPGPAPGEDTVTSSSSPSPGAQSAPKTPDIESREKNEPPEGDWDVMEKELAAWGRQLDQLRVKAHLVGKDALGELESRYEEVNRQAQALRQEAEEQMKKAQSEAAQNTARTSEQAREAMKDTQEFVEKTTAQATENLKEVSEKLWIGAQEMGEGFKRAWVELRQAFDSASTKMQEKDQSQEKS